MTGEQNIFQTLTPAEIWQRYCGFLDLSLDEFMDIQQHLLIEQINMIAESALAKKFMPQKPQDVPQFRQIVPLTKYEDYASYLNEHNESVLAFKPYCWARTSGRGGSPKWIPYTERAADAMIRYGVAEIIMACTERKGEVNIRKGMRLLYNVPPAPYMSGVMAHLVSSAFGARDVLPYGKYEKADFETRLREGFRLAMLNGVDLLGSMTAVLIRMGESFAASSGQLKLTRQMLNPKLLYRFGRAFFRAKRESRKILPKDLWPLKGLMAFGMDTSIYRKQLLYYWGREPLEIYSTTESGNVAFQAWNKKDMTFVPASAFFEFIPEDEWLKNRENKSYQPKTILLNEVEAGKRYEVVFTSFYGMPFLRYRVGDLIKVTRLGDEEAGIKIPQMVFESRADDLIDISSFTRLDEKTVWQAIVNTGVKYEDWTIRKEFEQDKPILHLYVELKEPVAADQLAKSIHQQLLSINSEYRDLETMLNIRPLRITLLPAGSFQQYLEEQRKAGADLAHLKPSHMNAPDKAIQLLLRLMTK